MSAKTMATSGKWTIPSDPGQGLQRGGLDETRPVPRVKPEAAVIAKANVDGTMALVFQQQQAPKRPQSCRIAEPIDYERENMKEVRKIQAQSKEKERRRREEAASKSKPLRAVHPPGVRAKVDTNLCVDGTEMKSRAQPVAGHQRPPSCQSCGQRLPQRRTPTEVPELDIASASTYHTPAQRHGAAADAPKARAPPRDAWDEPDHAAVRRKPRPRSASVDRRPMAAARRPATTAVQSRTIEIGGVGGQRRPATAVVTASYQEPKAPRRKSSGRNFVSENIGRMADQPRLTRSASLSQLSVEGTTKLKSATGGYQRGKLPSYLVKRREQWQQDEQDRIARRPDPNCPPGHVQLSNGERLATLTKLENKHDKMTAELQSLPVRYHDTLRVKNRKTELEKTLQELDDALKIFSRPKVYVRQED